ncbi:unnamed protein product [Musa hybrid cultivar]
MGLDRPATVELDLSVWAEGSKQDGPDGFLRQRTTHRGYFRHYNVAQPNRVLRSLYFIPRVEGVKATPLGLSNPAPLSLSLSLRARSPSSVPCSLPPLRP